MSKPWFSPGKWHVSPLNFTNEVTADFEYPPDMRVFVSEYTIAKIMELPGAPVLPINDFIDIAAAMDALGVDSISANLYGNRPLKEENLQIVKAIADQGFKSKVAMGTCIGGEGSPMGEELRRLSYKDFVDRPVDAGVEILGLSLPTLASFHSDKVGRYSEADIDRLLKALQYAKDRGVRVESTCLDNGRLDDLNYFIEHINMLIDQVDISGTLYFDSYGCMIPEAMRYAIKKIRKDLGKTISVGVHVHNDLGLANATTVAAVTGGANLIEVSTNGLGFKGGLASLGEVVATLEILHGVKTGIRLEKLAETYRLVEEKTGIPSEPYRSITGKNAYVYEGEQHVVPILENAQDRSVPQEVFRAVNPTLVGQKKRVVWGASTLGGEALKRKLSNMGLEYTAGDLDRIIEIIRRRLRELKSYPVWVTEEEVEQICRNVLQKK